MNKFIFLNDVDRPNEGFEAIVEHATDWVLTLVVPNTIVRFRLRRADLALPYKGELGGRWFSFMPLATAGAKKAG